MTRDLPVTSGDDVATDVADEGARPEAPAGVPDKSAPVNRVAEMAAFVAEAIGRPVACTGSMAEPDGVMPDQPIAPDIGEPATVDGPTWASWEFQPDVIPAELSHEPGTESRSTALGGDSRPKLSATMSRLGTPAGPITARVPRAG